MVAQLQNFKLQRQPQALPISYLSLSKVTSQKIVVSVDLSLDHDPVQGIAQVFIKRFNLVPHTS